MLRDACMVFAGAIGALVLEGGALAIVVTVMWRRHIREIDR